MKIKNLFITLGLAVAAMAAIGAGLKASGAKETNAEGSLPNKIYLKVTGTHWQDWGNYKAHMWNSNSGTTWGTGTSGTLVEVGSEQYYSFDVGSYEHVIFIASNDWNNYQNRTVDLDIPTNGNDLFILSTNNASDKQNGSWSKMYAEAGTKMYFVDGYSWHSSKSVKAYAWGENDEHAWPGNVCTDTGLRLKAYVGDQEFSGLQIFEYTLSAKARYVIFNDGQQSNAQQTGNLLIENGAVYYYEVSDNYEPVVELLLTLKSQMGAATFNGRSFANSICALSQSQAQSFVSSFNSLLNNANQRLGSSVQGSGLVTYSDPENNNTSTGEVTLTQVKVALLTKYPSISGSTNPLSIIGINNNSTIIIVVISALVLVSTGGFFFLRKKQENE